MKPTKSIYSKLGWYITFTSVIMVVVAAALITIYQKTVKTYRMRIAQTETLYTDYIDLAATATTMQMTVEKVLRIKDLDTMEYLLGQFDTLHAHISTSVKGKMAGDPSAAGTFDSLGVINRKVIQQLLSNDLVGANYAYQSESNPTFQTLLVTIEHYRTKMVGQFNQETIAIQRSTDRFLLIAVAISLICLVGGIVWGLRFRHAMITPLQQLISMLDDIVHGNGDLTKRIVIRSNDEFGVVAELFNRFIEQQQSIIAKIAMNAATLNEAATGLFKAADSITAQSKSIAEKSSHVNQFTTDTSTGITSISSSAEEMSSTIGTLATASEQISATINEIAKNCQKESAIAADAATIAKSNYDLINRFSETAKKINMIIDTINDIAEQTKMLALNATIESASAGDAGRGFAVVAGEVKSLARLTAQSTSEISTQIMSIQNDIKESIVSSEKILKVIEEVSAISRSIASAVEEQSITVNNVVRNIAETSNVSGSIAQSVGSSARHIGEISQTIQSIDHALTQSGAQVRNLQESAGSLSRLSTELDAIVKKFKLR
jgi:methyl-accepting chemotaxis protein